MSIQFPKFLVNVVVPTGGWDFVNGDGTATIPAGTYDTPLHLFEELETQITATIDACTITVSSVGIVTIAIDTFAAMTWGSCSAALLAVLGLSGSESIVSNTLTASSAHTHGWYPGVISFGASGGAGPASDTQWRVEDRSVRSIAGSGLARIIAPARRLYQRRLRFGPLTLAEVFKSRGRGPMDFQDRWETSQIWWYRDRTQGDVGSYGTQLDPGAQNFEVDTDGAYYYLTTLARPPEFQNPTSHPDWYTVELTLSPEPK